MTNEQAYATRERFSLTRIIDQAVRRPDASHVADLHRLVGANHLKRLRVQNFVELSIHDVRLGLHADDVHIWQQPKTLSVALLLWGYPQSAARLVSQLFVPLRVDGLALFVRYCQRPVGSALLDGKRLSDAIDDDLDRERDERSVEPKEVWVVAASVLRELDSVVAAQGFEERSVLDRARYVGLAPTVETGWKLRKIAQVYELRPTKHPPLYCRPQDEGNLRDLVDDYKPTPVRVPVQTVVQSAAVAPVRGDALGRGVREGCAQHLFFWRPLLPL